MLVVEEFVGRKKGGVRGPVRVDTPPNQHPRNTYSIPHATIHHNVPTPSNTLPQYLTPPHYPLCVYAQGALPSLPEVVGLCLSHLPIYDDVVEARTVHRQVKS